MASLRNGVIVAVAVMLVVAASQSTAQEQEPVPWSKLVEDLEKFGSVKVTLDHPVVLVSIERDSTIERGLLSLEWQQRQIVNLELLTVGDQSIVADTDWTVLSKAPLGQWHEVPPDESMEVTALPDVGTVITGVPH